MFVFLSKKIAIPNGPNIHSLSWNAAQGYIACGGENGLLKVLKLDTAPDSKARGIAAPVRLIVARSLACSRSPDRITNLSASCSLTMRRRTCQ